MAAYSGFYEKQLVESGGGYATQTEVEVKHDGIVRVVQNRTEVCIADMDGLDWLIDTLTEVRTLFYQPRD